MGHGLFHGLEVKAAVLAELGVLGGNDRTDQGRGNGVDGAPVALEAPALDGSLDHEPGQGRRDDPIGRRDHHGPDQAKDQDKEKRHPCDSSQQARPLFLVLFQFEGRVVILTRGVPARPILCQIVPGR